MSVTAVVCEYNPFHNGHKYHIQSIKASENDLVVAVMSPNVVQRGDFALLDKWTRTKAALMCGADLVLEIPSVFALSTAERYAFGAVSIINELGFVDNISFGSECGNMGLINKTAELIDSGKIDAFIKEELKKGISYPAARENAAAKIAPETREVLSQPNNLLAVEYVRQLKRLNSSVKPKTLTRIKTEHDSNKTLDNFASASYIRENFNKDTILSFTPKDLNEMYLDLIGNGSYSNGVKSLENAVIAKLRTSSAQELLNFADVSEGLENRIIAAANEAASLNELYSKIKTKRYTHSRITRIIMSLLIGIDKSLQTERPPYIRVLGFNEKGSGLLKKISGNLPLVTSLKGIEEYGKTAEAFANIEQKCTALYAMTFKDKAFIKNEYQNRIITL